MSSCIGADEYGAGCKSGSLINWCLNCISEDTHGTFCTNLRPSRSNTHHHAWIWTITYIIIWNGAAILQTRKKIMIRFIVLGGHNVVISPGIPPDSTSHVTARSTPPTILKHIQSQHSNRTLNQTTRSTDGPSWSYSTTSWLSTDGTADWRHWCYSTPDWLTTDGTHMVEILAANANLHVNQTRLLSASLTLLASTVLLDLDRGRAQRTTSHTDLHKIIHTKNPQQTCCKRDYCTGRELR